MDNNNGEVVYLYLDDIIPNRFQPREVFDDQALKELAVSIKEHGVIQPIIVRKVENKYEIIAGERRYKASTMAGLTKIPAIIKDLDDKESSKIALIENLQRKDLTPIEEARTYQKILELEDNMTQEQLAATMGKTQSSVSNKLRLLALPEEIQDALLKEKISERHARSLLNLEDKNDQIKMLDRIVSEKLTVRELDKAIKEVKGELTEEPGGEQAVNLDGGNSISTVASIAPATADMNIGVQPTEEGLTATDIVGENNFPQIDANSLLNPPAAVDNEAQVATTDTTQEVVQEQVTEPATNPALQTFNLANFSTPKEEPTEPETTVPETTAPLLNPTEVDINKIRENSVDIGGINQNAQIETNNVEQETVPAQTEEFTFVPTFEFNGANNTDANNGADQSNIQVTDQQPTDNNNFNGYFDANLSTPTQIDGTSENTNFASSMSTTGLTVPNSNLNFDFAITDIKNTIDTLKQKGYNISFEEANQGTNYTITINLQK
jgi:ParB family chromosome partitioning protein